MTRLAWGYIRQKAKWQAQRFFERPNYGVGRRMGNQITQELKSEGRLSQVRWGGQCEREEGKQGVEEPILGSCRLLVGKVRGHNDGSR